MPTDRPWALYPFKANSHSACLNILLNPPPLPSHSHHTLHRPPFSSSSSGFPLSLSLAAPWLRVQTRKSPDRVGRVQVQAGWKGGRGGEPSIVGLDSALSPLEHPLMGEARWQSRILIWLCKCLLQKAIRCNPYPVVEMDDRRGISRNVERESLKNNKNTDVGRCNKSVSSRIYWLYLWDTHTLSSLTHILHYQGGLRTTQHTLKNSLNGHWLSPQQGIEFNIQMLIVFPDTPENNLKRNLHC